ncbi:MAG: MBL fold metallo-hydrolase [Chloroflexota bacterium]
MNEIVVIDVNKVGNRNPSHTPNFVLVGEHSPPILVEAGSNPLGILQEKGFEDNEIEDVVLTHFHPDQVNAIPNIFMHLWLNGRQESMRFYGLNHCIKRVQDLLDAHGWVDWPNFFPVGFLMVHDRDDAPVLENQDYIIRAFPLEHSVPNIGLRIFNKHRGTTLSYISGTHPCENAIITAQDSDMLIYEISPQIKGHSTASQAGQVATEADVKMLYINPWNMWRYDRDELYAEAHEHYQGTIRFLEDFESIQF